jgi:hypothetical protein
MSDPYITILGERIPCVYEEIDINKLSYSSVNPRITPLLELNSDHEKLSPPELKNHIYDLMLKESSVTNIKEKIYENEGTLDPIIVRKDRDEVVEGNSRLTVYMYWHNEDKLDPLWQTIPCYVVSELTQLQQDWYQRITHIDQKTPWAKYAKSLMVFNSHRDGNDMDYLKTAFVNNETEINKRIKSVRLMKSNDDNKTDNFSYYDEVLVRNGPISEAVNNSPKLKSLLLEGIKEGSFLSAGNLRDKLKKIVEHPKQLKKFIDQKISLDESYEAIKTTDPHEKIKTALNRVSEVETKDISKMDRIELNKIKISTKHLIRAVDRIDKLIKKNLI